MTHASTEAVEDPKKVRREYVAAARDAAVKLHLSTGLPITIDDVRKVCPPPEGVDGRVMGSVLRQPEWVKTGYINSDRKACHNRVVSQFIWSGPV